MEKKRLQFDFTLEAVDRIDELAGKLNASSRAEVVRRALSLLEHVIDVASDESVVMVKDKSGNLREVLILGA
ncbi:MAG: ribbon-helix-helix protein, CopG family [Planctomycetota bacterium]|jgi:ATP-dependent protease HslVU (ClpYQ) ATPase subunit